jgi:predicted nucleotidyltransferase
LEDSAGAEADLLAVAGVSGFLEAVKSTSLAVCGDHLVSIRQFGSIIDGEYKPGISDVDFIVLATDDCSLETVDSLRNRLIQLEATYNVTGFGEVGAVQRTIASRTALFKSHFVFHRSTIEKQRYSQMIEEAETFNLSGSLYLRSFLTIVLPWRLVLANVVSQSRLVFGEDALDNYEPVVPWEAEAARAFLVALALFLLGLVHSFLSSDGTRLSLEATKWYLIDVNSCLKRKRVTLAASVERFRSFGMGAFMDRFMKLRSQYSSDRLFSILCLVLVLPSVPGCLEEGYQSLSLSQCHMGDNCRQLGRTRSF